MFVGSHLMSRKDSTSFQFFDNMFVCVWLLKNLFRFDQGDQSMSP